MAWLEGSTGVEERGMSAWGFPRNLGGPILSADRNAVGEAATRNNPGPVARGIDPAGSEQRMHGRYHGDKQETPGDEGWEVGVPHSSGEAGELTWRTLWSEGGAGKRNCWRARRWEYQVPQASQRNNSG
jgi:hypothetical protein